MIKALTAITGLIVGILIPLAFIFSIWWLKNLLIVGLIIITTERLELDIRENLQLFTLIAGITAVAVEYFWLLAGSTIIKIIDATNNEEIKLSTGTFHLTAIALFMIGLAIASMWL